MEVNKAISKEGLKWRCCQHPNLPCDFINLDGDNKDRVMCFRCIQINSIPNSNLISMGCVLGSKEAEILESYPPLKDQELSDKLRRVSLEQNLEEIDLFFKKLMDDFEREVKAAKKRAKEILIKQEQASQEILEGYIRIAEIQKLKELIVSDKEGAEKDLDEFIKDKWNKAEENRKVFLNLMNKYETKQLSFFDEPQRIAQKMIDGLKNINFFEKSTQQQGINLIKSTYGSSQELAITKIDNSIYQIKQEASGGWGQVFMDPILNPLKKYILQIEVEMKRGNSNNHFLFGIVEDERKDNGHAYNQNMCYFDYCSSNGITKYIKGDPMQSGSKAAGKHSFEIRVHLDKKLMRVASLPNYSSIVELDEPNKIDTKVNYRFFLAIYYQGDMIRITNVSVVDNFDRKM